MSVKLEDWLDGQGEDAPLLFWAATAQGWHRSPPKSVGLAVSGGSDSMAMLHLMARVAPQTGWALKAVTVDHRLRPEAAEEAAFVGRACAALSIPHDILIWDHGALHGNLMQAAREARYGLLADWAKRAGVDLVTLAHTADDQAETFLMGLSRAAGLDGLAGMRDGFVTEGTLFRRPFLQQFRAELRAYLTRQGVQWIDDPSNDNDRFTRVKARRAIKALAPLGITVDRLSGVVHNLSMALSVVQDAVAKSARDTVTETVGALRVERKAFRNLHPEIRRRLLVAMVRWISGALHPPRETKLAALGLALDLGKDATLGGVRFRWQGETLWISREARGCGGPVPAGQLWDRRWRIDADAGDIRALGANGLRQCPDWRALGLPRQVLEVTPGLWQGQVLIAAPWAGFGQAAATCTPSFSDFILSH